MMQMQAKTLQVDSAIDGAAFFKCVRADGDPNPPVARLALKALGDAIAGGASTTCNGLAGVGEAS